MQRGSRTDLVQSLVELIESTSPGHPTRVAIDGPPAAGKTTLADELAHLLASRRREPIRASIDDFLTPIATRYRRGEFSGEGCYRDAHDHDAVNRLLLDPLGPAGDRHVWFALPKDAGGTPTSPPREAVGIDAVLLFDGVFLMRPELDARWEVRVHIRTTPEQAVSWATQRDEALMSHRAIERRWRERYLPAQSLYDELVRPTEHADIVIDNDDPDRPSWQGRTR